MNEQISLRLPPKLLKDARTKAKKQGFGSVQEFIEQTVRAELYDLDGLTPREQALIDATIEKNNKENSWIPEKELMKKLKESVRKSS